MDITEMRSYAGLSRADFSRKYGIPLRTLESWEAGVRTPPAYVRRLLEESIRKSDIIQVTFAYDYLLQEDKIYPWSAELADKYGADQATYKTIINVCNKFRKEYPHCEWEDDDIDYIDAIEEFAQTTLLKMLGKQCDK